MYMPDSVDLGLKSNMNVNGRVFFILCLQALEVLSKVNWMSINDANTLLSDEYSWLATMVYGSTRNDTSGNCGGAVINAQFVLTAARCVTGSRIVELGGLTAVRLGDYTRRPYCVYGTSNCNSSLQYEVAHIQSHESYGVSTKNTILNDIALVRINGTIQFEPIMRRVHLPYQQIFNTQLTVSGWVLPISPNEFTTTTYRKFKYTKPCKYHRNMMWTGLLVAPETNEKLTRGNYSGRHMVIGGIVSFLEPTNCANLKIVSNYTRVVSYLPWIESNSLINGSDNSTVKQNPTHAVDIPTFPPQTEETTEGLPKSTTNTSVVYQFPKDCGYSPIYPRELIDSGYKIEPDEFTWLASLVYRNNDSAFGHCSGSVISAHYVLTTRECVITKGNLGMLVGVRLGVFDKESYCDYGTESCQQYDYFNITDRIFAPNSERTKNNLALLKLDRDIKFGPKMKPICLPFDETNIPPPFEDSFLTVAGWWTTTYPNDVIAKRSAAVAFWNTTSCVKARLDKERQVCGVKPGTSPCTVELGSPLMNMFERRRMVLEAIAYDKVADCPGTDVGTLYTRVRSFKTWIEDSIRELETRSQNDQISYTTNSPIQTQNKRRKGTSNLKGGLKTA